jgi:hypothetical protein
MFAKVFLTGIAVAALAVAQGQGGGGAPGGGGGGGRGGGMDSGGMGGGNMGRASYHKESKAEQVANRLKLSSDQKTEYNSILQTTWKDAAPIVQQVLKSHQDLANAMLNGKSEAEVAPLNQALSDAEFQMTGVEVKTFQKIIALLKPNQLSKAPEAFDLMAGIFLPQGAGRGGWGGR